MTSADTLRELTVQTKEKCLEWVNDINGETFFVDPLDQEEISAHYGASHAAVAFLILGMRNGDSDLEATGVKLLSSILNRWDTSSKLPGFHNDFNNFALCIAYGYIYEKYTDLAARIKKTVLSTADSPHDTVNWIPMRWFVNKCRYDWTKDEKYQSACTVCAGKIKSATYEDGFIDDRLPKGMSFNLQYDVATVAVLQYLRIHVEQLDISKETGALLNVVAPDGDINYFGRGTNQVFAWGLWLYLLASAGFENDLQKALGYCSDKIPVMLEKNNLMLNNWEGEEKHLWWDYHYCSVYTAHLLLWLVLALEDYGKNPFSSIISAKHDSGIEVIRKNGWFVTSFSGRTEYLAEKGPIIAAIGRSDGKVLVKGAFGPWGGMFGNEHSNPYSTISNFFGLVFSDIRPKRFKNRVLRKMETILPKTNCLMQRPIFSHISVGYTDDVIDITFETRDENNIVLNLPILLDKDKYFEFEVVNGIDNERLFEIGIMRNQYGYYKIYRSTPVCSGRCSVRIKMREDL